MYPPNPPTELPCAANPPNFRTCRTLTAVTPACVLPAKNVTLPVLGGRLFRREMMPPTSKDFSTMNHQRGSAATSVLLAFALCLAIFSTACDHRKDKAVKFDTPYQAVLLANGSVYFGHLNDYGTHHPVLTDVFYIVSQTDPTTKAVNNVLVKRGKELHAPDRMYLTPTAIVFVEPVGKDSKVAQLIAQAEH